MISWFEALRKAQAQQGAGEEPRAGYGVYGVWLNGTDGQFVAWLPELA